MKLALLTYSKLPELSLADQKMIPVLAHYGLDTEPVIWDAPKVDWSIYNALIIRSTWDYYLIPDVFSTWLQMIENVGLRIFNPLQVIRKNMHKFYLREMELAGIRIIPSIFVPSTSNLNIRSLLPSAWTDVVIKPAVSAGSFLTTLFKTDQIDTINNKYASVSKERDLILQKFMPEIITSGEISLVFFNKKYAHAVIKKPKENDFRIQSQFGGKYQLYFPNPKIISTAQSIVNYIPEQLLYARVDGIVVDDVFYLMELELIEPDLYLDLVDDGCERFGHEIARQLGIT